MATVAYCLPVAPSSSLAIEEWPENSYIEAGINLEFEYVLRIGSDPDTDADQPFQFEFRYDDGQLFRVDISGAGSSSATGTITAFAEDTEIGSIDYLKSEDLVLRFVLLEGAWSVFKGDELIAEAPTTLEIIRFLDRKLLNGAKWTHLDAPFPVENISLTVMTDGDLTLWSGISDTGNFVGLGGEGGTLTVFARGGIFVISEGLRHEIPPTIGHGGGYLSGHFADINVSTGNEGTAITSNGSIGPDQDLVTAITTPSIDLAGGNRLGALNGIGQGTVSSVTKRLRRNRWLKTFLRMRQQLLGSGDYILSGTKSNRSLKVKYFNLTSGKPQNVTASVRAGAEKQSVSSETPITYRVKSKRKKPKSGNPVRDYTLRFGVSNVETGDSDSYRVRVEIGPLVGSKKK